MPHSIRLFRIHRNTTGLLASRPTTGAPETRRQSLEPQPSGIARHANLAQSYPPFDTTASMHCDPATTGVCPSKTPDGARGLPQQQSLPSPPARGRRLVPWPLEHVRLRQEVDPVRPAPVARLVVSCLQGAIKAV
eukprot:scaffold1928_cov381-Prasinococcus_capsulatus_cf.AAC.2